MTPNPRARAVADRDQSQLSGMEKIHRGQSNGRENHRIRSTGKECAREWGEDRMKTIRNVLLGAQGHGMVAMFHDNRTLHS